MNEEKNIVESMRQYIKMSLDDEFTKIKNNLLKELDNQMEMKRNNLVEQVLNATDIQIGKTPMGMQLNISIEKIVKVISNE